MKKWVAGIGSGVVLGAAGITAIAILVSHFFGQSGESIAPPLVGYTWGCISYLVGYGVYTWIDVRDYEKEVMRETMKDIDKIRDER